jgi:hypothetical protein
MTSGHTSYEDLASQRRDSDEYRQGHAEAQRAYLLGKAVRDRRLALGLRLGVELPGVLISIRMAAFIT